MAAADPVPYFAASAVSAFVTFPFWKAATIGQSGYALKASSMFGRFWEGDPQVSFAARSRLPNLEVLKHLRRTKGAGAWFLGTGVGIFRTVPKYVTAIVAKDVMERYLEPADAHSTTSSAIRSAKKSMAAGVVGAVLTNPLDVLQNEMFKTEENVVASFRRLCSAEGCRWLTRGIEKNVIASAIPIAATMFLTDTFSSWRRSRSSAA